MRCAINIFKFLKCSIFASGSDSFILKSTTVIPCETNSEENEKITRDVKCEYPEEEMLRYYAQEQKELYEYEEMNYLNKRVMS